MNEDPQAKTCELTYTAAPLAVLHPQSSATQWQTPVPVITSLGGAAEFVRQQLGIRVTLTSLGKWPAQVGLALMHCEPELVAVLFDPSDRDGHRWLSNAAERGLMRFALKDDDGIAVVDMTCDDLIDELRCSIALPQTLDPQHLRDAVHVLNGALSTEAGRKRLLVDDAGIRRVNVAVVTGTAQYA